MESIYIIDSGQNTALFYFCPQCCKFNTDTLSMWYSDYIDTNIVLWNMNSIEENWNCPHLKEKEFVCVPIHAYDWHGTIKDYPCFEEMELTQFKELFPQANLDEVIECFNSFKPVANELRPQAIEVRPHATEVKPEATELTTQANAIPNFKIYKVGLLEITAWGRTINTSENEHKLKYIRKLYKYHTHTRENEYFDKVYLINTTSKHSNKIDYSHDGVELWYEGTCRVCKKNHLSSISGD